jgi:hypothetical protein
MKMKNKRSKKKCIRSSDALFSTVERLKAGLLLLILAVFFQFLARNVNGFAQWYATSIYRILVTIISRVCSVFPFSIVEILLYVLLVVLAAGVMRGICRKTEKASTIALKGSSWVCLLVGGLFFIYTMTCGINYHRTSFAEEAGITDAEYSQEELVQLAEYLTEEVNELADTVPRTKEGIFVLKGNTKKEAVRSMEHLAETYSVLEGYYPNPKPVWISEILSYQHLTGVYSPFTIEANYNADMTDYNIPFTMCHELSHLRGFMSEDEANFIAYLSCIKSESEEFRYSGFLSGWLYVINALYGENTEKYEELCERLNINALKDLQANNSFWDKYDGITAEVADRVNDIYLKANRQIDGVKSYGKVVDLMLGYQRIMQ